MLNTLTYNLRKYSNNCLKTSEILWQYYSNEPFLDANGSAADFPADDNNSASFKFKIKIAGRTGNDGTKDVKIMMPLKYLSNFWRTLEMPLIDCEINLILTWSANCFIIDAPVNNQVSTFTITDTKLYVPFVTLSTQDNAKLLLQLKSGFKRVINWNKYQSKVTLQERKRYLDYLINPSFQGVGRLFHLLYENNAGRISYKRYYLPQVDIKDYNVMINGQNFFDQPVKNNLRTYDNIRNIAAGQGDDYTTGCLQDYPYFKNYYKMIAIDLNKQQELDVDKLIYWKSRSTRKHNNINEEAKETILDFSQGTLKVL